MNLIQSIRRLRQQCHEWDKTFDAQVEQLKIIKKLYLNNGLSIVLTSPACPEQYEIFKNDLQVAYFRLRHGEFRIDIPDCGGETIYEASPNGDGSFFENERLIYLSKALREVLNKIN